MDFMLATGVVSGALIGWTAFCGCLWSSDLMYFLLWLSLEL